MVLSVRACFVCSAAVGSRRQNTRCNAIRFCIPLDPVTLYSAAEIQCLKPASVGVIDAVNHVASEASVKYAGVSIMASTMDNDGVLVIRGPSDILGSEVSLIQNSEGLWNATSMGKHGGREWGQFYRSDKVREYIRELARQLSVPESEVVKYEAHSGKGAGGTTWIHKRLAFRFLAHQSAKFAVWADGVLERYLGGEITTEESQAAKAEYDSLLKEHKIKYEESQKRVAAWEKAYDMQKEDHNARTKRLAARVHTATEEADDLRAKLAKAKKKETKKSRLEDNKQFLTNLRNALKTDRTNSWPDIEEGFGQDKDGLPMTVPGFVQYLHGHSDHEWRGKDYDMFGERPGVGWNIVPRNKFHEAPAEEFRLYSNFVPAFNHSDRHKVLVDAGDNPEYAAVPTSKKPRWA